MHRHYREKEYTLIVKITVFFFFNLTGIMPQVLIGYLLLPVNLNLDLRLRYPYKIKDTRFILSGFISLLFIVDK